MVIHKESRAGVRKHLSDCLIPAELDVFFLFPSIILPNWMENLRGIEQLPEN